MATAESVDELRRSLESLRHEVETQTTAEKVIELTQGLAGLRQEVEAKMISGQELLSQTIKVEVEESFQRLPSQEEFHTYIQAMEKKIEDDQEAVKKQLAELKVAVNLAMAAASAATSPGQAFAAAVPAGSAHNMHLTQRKGVRWSPAVRRRRPVAGLAVHYGGLAPPGEAGLRDPPQDHRKVEG